MNASITIFTLWFIIKDCLHLLKIIFSPLVSLFSDCAFFLNSLKPARLPLFYLANLSLIFLYFYLHFVSTDVCFKFYFGTILLNCIFLFEFDAVF